MEEISLEETEGVALETEGVSLESEVHESSWGEVVESDFLTADMPVAEESEVDVTVEKQRNMMVMIVASDQGTSGETDVVEEEWLDPGEHGVETVSKKPSLSSVCALPDDEKTVHNSEKRYISTATLMYELMLGYQRSKDGLVIISTSSHADKDSTTG